MLLTISALVLTLSHFGSDSLEMQMAELQENACIFFEESVATETVTAEPTELAEAEPIEVVESVVEVEEAETDLQISEIEEAIMTGVELEPEDDLEIVGTTTPSPETSVIEDEIEVAVVDVEEIVTEEVATESTTFIEEDSAEHVAARWSELSEEARESILLLIEIDLGSQE